MMQNFFALRAPLKELITQAAGAGIVVRAADELDEQTLRNAELPTVFLVYAGEEIGEQRGASQSIRQFWLVLLAVPVDDDDTGRLYARISNALSGRSVRADGIHAEGVLQREPAPAPLYEGARAYFSMIFSMQVRA